MANQNTKTSSEIEFALFNCTGEISMDNSGFLNSSVSLFLFCCNEIVKINYGARTLTAEPPPPYTSQYPCSWTTFPSKHRYFKDDP